MGTGSSCCSPTRVWRRPRWGSGSGSAPARPSRAEEPERADAAARFSPALAQAPLPPLEEPDSDSDSWEQLLSELEANNGQGDRAQGGRQTFLAASENSNFANNLPLKKPERTSKTSYDCSEEDMMAAIEQEYSR